MEGQAKILLADANGEYKESTSNPWHDLGEYGVTLTRGWREALLKPASVKDYTKNDSRLENGIRMVAASKYTKLKEREIQINCIIEGSSESDYLSKYRSFLNAIAYGGMIYLKVPILNRIYKLVYTDCSKFGDFGLKKGNFTLKFTEPDPSDMETITEQTTA